MGHELLTDLLSKSFAFECVTKWVFPGPKGPRVVPRIALSWVMDSRPYLLEFRHCPVAMSPHPHACFALFH